jgi:hypothetical protein
MLTIQQSPNRKLVILEGFVKLSLKKSFEKNIKLHQNEGDVTRNGKKLLALPVLRAER